MTIFVDMDDVLVELLDAWTHELNKISKYNKQPSDITDWEMKLAYPDLTSNQIFDILGHVDFWKNVRQVNDAYTYMKKLIQDGHKVYVATASYPLNFFVKTEYCLFKIFDFLSPDNVICIHDKFLLNGDILFDDYYENLRKFKGIKVLKTAAYNVNCPEECFHFRVSKENAWKDFYTIITVIGEVGELCRCID